MSYPTLTKIRSFVAVAQSGRFRKAAEGLNIAQPTLSAHVADLEAYLGVSLLSRTTRSIRLTADGERFLGQMQKLLDGLDGAIADVRDGATLNRGRLAVACVPTISLHMLPQLLTGFRSRYPAIDIKVIERIASDVLRQVEDGVADFGIVPDPQTGIDLDFVPFAREEFVAVVPRSSDFARRDRVTMEEIFAQPFITLEPGSNIRRVLDQASAECGFQIRPRYEFLHHQSVVAMIAAGDGVSILPAAVVASLGALDVIAVRLADPKIYRELGIICRRGERLSPVASAFADEIHRRWHTTANYKAWNRRMKNTITAIPSAVT